MADWPDGKLSQGKGMTVTGGLTGDVSGKHRTCLAGEDTCTHHQSTSVHINTRTHAHNHELAHERRPHTPVRTHARTHFLRLTESYTHFRGHGCWVCHASVLVMRVVTRGEAPAAPGTTQLFPPSPHEGDAVVEGQRGRADW